MDGRLSTDPTKYILDLLDCYAFQPVSMATILCNFHQYKSISKR